MCCCVSSRLHALRLFWFCGTHFPYEPNSENHTWNIFHRLRVQMFKKKLLIVWYSSAHFMLVFRRVELLKRLLIAFLITHTQCCMHIRIYFTISDIVKALRFNCLLSESLTLGTFTQCLFRPGFRPSFRSNFRPNFRPSFRPNFRPNIRPNFRPSFNESWSISGVTIHHVPLKPFFTVTIILSLKMECFCFLNVC